MECVIDAVVLVNKVVRRVYLKLTTMLLNDANVSCIENCTSIVIDIIQPVLYTPGEIGFNRKFYLIESHYFAF